LDPSAAHWTRDISAFGSDLVAIQDSPDLVVEVAACGAAGDLLDDGCLVKSG
jgi:hypothetical protein